MTDDAGAFLRSETPKTPLRPDTGIAVLGEEISAALPLEWRGVTVTARAKSKKQPADDAPPILSSVDGFAVPGELLVVIGPLGAGKKTLLDVLGGRAPAGLSPESAVTAGGVPLTKAKAHHHVGYVLPNDLFIPVLTVRTHLLFQAKLRTSHTTPTALQLQVDRVLRENGLDAVHDSPIATISAGLKKRLAIASELVGHASILLVDEPTAGLDSFTAASIVSQLKHIASRGNKTVIAAISKPSSEVFALFDKVLLLAAGGKVVYHGSASGAIGYFTELGYPCPPYFSAADHLLAQLSVAPTLPSLVWDDHLEPVSVSSTVDSDTDRVRIAKLAQAWEAFRHSEAFVATLPPQSASVLDAGSTFGRELEKAPHAQPAKPSGTIRALYDLAVLAHRNVARIAGDKKVTLRMLTIQPMVVSVVVGLIYLQPDMDQLGMQCYSSIFFVFTVVMVMMNAVGQLLTVPAELAIVEREHQAGLYHAVAWYLAKNLTELPQQIVQPFFFLLPAYFMAGIGHGADLFFYLAVILILVASTAVGFGYMISCVARRTGAVAPIGFVILIPMLILGGVLVNPKSIRDYLVWLEYLSPFKYSFEAMMNLFWTRVDSISCYPAATCTTTTGLAVLASRSLLDRTPWTSGLLLVALNAGFRLVGLISLLFL